MMNPPSPREASPAAARRFARWGAILALAALSTEARAVDCTPENATSTCIDADNLWLRPHPGRFVAIGARVPAAGGGAATAHLGYLRKPLEVVAPSPDPAGRELRVVQDVVGLTIAGAYAPLERLSVGAALPVVLDQQGTGLSGITTRESAPLASPVVRDPRLHLALELLRGADAGGFGVMVGLDGLLPIGASGSFAGERGFAAFPWAAGLLQYGILFGGLELGARLRQPVEIAGTEVGSQASLALGVGVRSLDDTLGVALEARALPNLSSTERVTPSGESVTERPIPSEWLLGAWASVSKKGDLTVIAALGGGIPLSPRSFGPTGGGAETELTTAPTTPAFRALLGVRWLFEPSLRQPAGSERKPPRRQAAGAPRQESPRE